MARLDCERAGRDTLQALVYHGPEKGQERGELVLFNSGGADTAGHGTATPAGLPHVAIRPYSCSGSGWSESTLLLSPALEKNSLDNASSLLNNQHS